MPALRSRPEPGGAGAFEPRVGGISLVRRRSQPVNQDRRRNTGYFFSFKNQKKNISNTFSTTVMEILPAVLQIRIILIYPNPEAEKIRY